MRSTYPFHVDPAAVADTGDETAIQARFRSRVASQAPGVRLAAVPNGGKRTAWAAMQAKREGLATGFPDLIALWAGGHAFLEFKTRTGPLKPEQIDYLNWLHRNGHACGVFRSANTALAFLRRQGAPFMAEAA